MIKKRVKHSRKFERTQTGCLQCRQKKKKCDGAKPECLSCSKKGIKCEFPANIRFFNFNQINNVSIGKVTKVPEETKPKINYNDLNLLPIEFDYEAEKALDLANDGKSINKILNDITLDVIKSSINNLQYINLNNFQKQNDFEIIKNGLKFENKVVTNKIDDFLMFEE